MKNWTSSRRDLIVHSLSGALGLSFAFSWTWEAKGSARSAAPAPEATLKTFVRIFTDNQIEILVAKAEMGQGVLSSMAMLIAEELEADWPAVRVRLAAETGDLIDPKFGGSGTFGSTSVRSQFLRLRQVGASVKAMLLAAAAQKFRIPVQELSARDAQIFDAEGQFLCTFGEVATVASQINLSEVPTLKDPRDFRLIGGLIGHKDSRDKAEGKVLYGIDSDLPGMFYAAVRHHPSFGSRLSNGAELRAMVAEPYQLLELADALILIGPSYWQSQKRLSALPARYEQAREPLFADQNEFEARLLKSVRAMKGLPIATQGNYRPQADDITLIAEYAVPYLAHNALEPLACLAAVEGDRCEIWLPSQNPDAAIQAIAQALKIGKNAITVHATFLGGAFGRKVASDFAVQAALASRAAGRPVKLIWSRQEDTQHDFYRPASQARFEAVIDPTEKRLKSWQAKNAGPSILRSFNPLLPLDPTSVEGFSKLPYSLGHLKIYNEIVNADVPLGFWRSVGLSSNTFFVESFVDEVAAALGRDPYAWRIEQLEADSAAQTVVNAVAALCQWTTHPEPQSLGMAYTEGFGSRAAMVAQVALDNNKLKIVKLWCVVDCGQVINRQGALAQIQGGSIFGLAAAMNGKITVADNRVQQSYFGEAPLLRLADCPEIEVSFIESGDELGGLGEIAVPLVAPAVCNAIFRLTGERLRRLPIADFKFSAAARQDVERQTAARS